MLYNIIKEGGNASEEKAKELICNAKMTAETFCVDNTIQNLNNIYAELF